MKRMFSMQFLFLAGEMSLELGVPVRHTVDLELVVLLSGALSDVSNGPLGETGCNLFDTDSWVSGVVTEVFVIYCSSLSFFWATMRELGFVVKSTFLVSSVKVSLHTGCVVCEFVNPCGL